jgi:hypothetical protein
MTRTTNARLAGAMFLLYIATAFPLTMMAGRVSAGDGIAAKLASIAQHVPLMRLTIVLSWIVAIEALLLAVALYAITRDIDRDLALLGFTFRAAEGVLNAITFTSMGQLWLATDGAAAAPEAVHALGEMFFKVETWQFLTSATLFSLGSTVFSWLLLRGRAIPVSLAWLGVVASLLLVAVLPARLVGVAGSPLTEVVWLPMLVFELVLGVWLLTKGVAPAPPARN